MIPVGVCVGGSERSLLSAQYAAEVVFALF